MMKELLKQMRNLLEKGKDLVLVTVLASSGSTPRGAGAHMLVGQEGRIAGTIGGGAVEHRAEQMAQEVLRDKTSLAHDFVLNKSDVQNLGMICGGDVSVLFSYIPAGDAGTLSVIAQAENSFQAGEDLWMLCDWKRNGRLSLYSPALGLTDETLPKAVIQQLSRRPQLLREGGMDIYAEQIAFAGRVYIFGCGHVGQELEPVLSHLGFRCTVMDDRPEFANRELFPTAEEVKCIDFRRISDSVSIQREDYVCVMTRGHAFDTIVEAQAIPCRPRYLGVIGSRTKSEKVRQTLKEEYGFSEEDLNRVTAPIGLPIHSETPAEIAISIAAQMIEIRANFQSMAESAKP